MEEMIRQQLEESARVKLMVAEQLIPHIVKAAAMITESYRQGGKLLLIGNGGSAADAQHIAGEFVGRFKLERKALPAIALTTNTTILTALSNDYGGDLLFVRNVEALANHKEDVLLAISTSGISPNIVQAVTVAKKNGIKVIGLTGKDGGTLKNLVDLAIVVPSHDTQRIQEAHIAIGHVICDLVERSMFGAS